MQESKIKETADGSHSIFSDKFQALYHSKHGAIQESNHVFLASGLHQLLNKKQINILEMGFGTGLNPLLTLLDIESKDINVHFETVEAYPIPVTEARKLNYLKELNREDLTDLFLNFHISHSGEIVVHNNFSFVKHLKKMEETKLKTKFDLVYYDAFAPQVQEELWTSEIFKHISTFLNPDAILVSYCCKGTFKRALISAGFLIEKIPGPPGKREMIRATYKS